MRSLSTVIGVCRCIKSEKDCHLSSFEFLDFLCLISRGAARTFLGFSESLSYSSGRQTNKTFNLDRVEAPMQHGQPCSCVLLVSV